MKQDNLELKATIVKKDAEILKLTKKNKMVTGERNVYLDRISNIKLINRDIKVKTSGYLDEEITDEQLKVELSKMGLTASRNIELEF